MLKNLVISPVCKGRISIGGTVEKNGKKAPTKNDFISITGMSQSGADNEWRPHPIEAELKEKTGAEKLRSIPVRVLFNKPESSFKAGYTCFEQKTGRPLCSGNGETARRRTSNGLETVECFGPEHCEFGADRRCKQFARLMIGVEGEFQKDPLSAFIFRTTSYNSIKAITARLEYMAALTGGKIAGMPCNLVMRSKSTAASYRKPIFYLDLEPAGDLLTAIKTANEFQAEWAANGLDRDALEMAVEAGLNAAPFFEASEDGAEIVSEFYDNVDVDKETGEITPNATNATSHQAANEASAPQTEQVAGAGDDELAILMEERGKSLIKLNEWLGRPSDEPLSTLNEEQRRKVYMVLAPALAEQKAA